MHLKAGNPIKGTKVDVAFLGSCTNGRLSDLTEVARHLKGRKVKPGVKAIVVPGSQGVSQIAEKMGLADNLPRRRLRMARRRVLDVPRNEPGQARRRPALRQLQQPELQGPPGQPNGPHRPDVPADGRRGSGYRGNRRRTRVFTELKIFTMPLEKITQVTGRVYLFRERTSIPTASFRRGS